MTEQAISPLRRRMIEDMTIRKFAQKTQHDYVQRVKDFANYLKRSPDTAKAEDVRGFQLHLTSSGAGIPKINITISALRFFFNVTLDRPDLSRHLSTLHKPRKVPVILSPDEMARFLEAAPGIKYKAAFSAQAPPDPHFRRRSGSTPHDDDIRAIARKSRSPVWSLLTRPRLSSLPCCFNKQQPRRSSPTHRPEITTTHCPPTCIASLTGQPTLAAHLSCGPPTAKSP
jgi:hypothetical protein